MRPLLLLVSYMEVRVRPHGLVVSKLTSAGFMTFCPEWLSGNTQLAGDDPVYLWLYLVFFNVLWVFIPAWVLWEAWKEVSKNFERAGQMTGWKKGT